MTEQQELPTAKQRYQDYSEWLQATHGYTVDAAQAQVAVTRYHEFQRSDVNQGKNAERLAANQAAKEARSAGFAERQAAAELKRQERAQAKEERELAKQAKADAKAARDAERSAADASAPKRGRGKAKQTAAEAVAEADGASGTVEFASDGGKRSEELADAAAF